MDIESAEKEVLSYNYQNWLPKTKMLIVVRILTVQECNQVQSDVRSRRIAKLISGNS